MNCITEKLSHMKGKIMNNTSKTDWARIDAMSDDEIDTSDIPPLTDECDRQSWRVR